MEQAKYIQALAPYLFDSIENLALPDSIVNGKLLFTRAATINDYEEDRVHRMKNRKLTNLALTGTIYGREHDILPSTRIHSPSGINVAMLLADGQINENELSNVVKQMVVADDARMVRSNQIVNSFLRADRYENYTALLFAIITFYYTLINTEKNTKKYENYKITKQMFDNAVALEGMNDERKLGAKLTELVLDELKIGYHRGKGMLLPGMSLILSHFSNSHTDYNISIPYYEIDDYNDGHTVISDIRGTEFGFVEKKFYAMDPRDYIVYYSSAFYHGQPFMNIGGIADLDKYASHKYRMRLDGMTTNEIAVLLYLLQGNTRCTPFLSDQEVLDIDLKDLHFYGPAGNLTDYYVAAEFDKKKISPQVVKSMLKKVVNNHRCYDDLLVAMRLANHLSSQPDADTVEAHSWIDMKWRICLPEFGAFRAIMIHMLMGEPCKLTADAMSLWTDVSGSWEYLITTGVITNALWHWGEYLRYVNVSSGQDQLLAIHQPTVVARERHTWVPALISAITGKSVPAYIFPGCGIELATDALDMFTDRVVKYNTTTLTMAQAAFWGWTIHAFTDHSIYHLSQPAPPTGIVAMINTAGSLVDNTPLQQQFKITNPSAQHGISRVIIKSDWYNTWAVGLVARYHGYDLGYTLGSDKQYKDERTIWAPNNVQIAYPPVFDLEADLYDGYRWFGTKDRQHTPAENPLLRMATGTVKRMGWFTTKLRLKALPDMKAYDATTTQMSRQPVSFVGKQFESDLNYIASVLAKYNVVDQDFQVHPAVIGVTLVDPISDAGLSGVQAELNDVADE